MSKRFRRHQVPSASEEDDLRQALDALSAPDLRQAVRAILDELDEDLHASIVDRLVAQATKAATGWKPARPPQRIVADAQSFADAARRVGHTDPDEVTRHLRLATKAFLAGDHLSARGVFEALLPPIAAAEIDLGQHELVDEVLGVDAHMCVAQYVASVYKTTPLDARVDAVLRAIEDAEGVGTLLSPIKDLEDVCAGSVPELDAFLPLWVSRLERFRPSKDEWETAHERWLREAVLRLEGVDGLERLARKTRRPQACLAWCEAVADSRRWRDALKAYEAAAKIVGASHWRGALLDGAALAAQELGRPDFTACLGRAWRAAPTVTRLVRWLAAGRGRPPTMRAQAVKALPHCPKNEGRQVGLLQLLAGDVHAAAATLSKAPGLGWSSEGHPGHVLFPAFAMLVARGRQWDIAPVLVSNLEAATADSLDAFRDAAERRATLRSPSMMQFVRDACAGVVLCDAERVVLHDAMVVAGQKRVDGIVGASRRRHYAHAATLVAACVACAPEDVEKATSGWVAGLRRTHSRKHAFREELTRALAAVGVHAHL